MEAGPTPVVFVHGLWLHAESWGPWLDAFNEAGYSASAVGWPGDGDTVEETRAAPDRVAGHGLAEIVAHHAAEIAKLDRKPIVVGHSFGGLIAQQLLSDGSAAAAVAIDPAPAKGVLYLPPSALRVASIALRNPANRNDAVSLTKGQFRYGFGNTLSEQESDDLWERWAIPSPGKPLFEGALANVTPGSPAAVDGKNATRGPLLITAGGKDHTVPATISRQTQRLYRKSPAITDLRTFADRGHSLTIDNGWREVADTVLGWLGGHGL
ncbi:MAG TPA: alpha/beta hydrolase [Gaiellaceae bacterium]